MPRHAVSRTQSTAPSVNRVVLVYAIANVGGVIAYLPLLTMLLPLKVATLATGATVAILSAASIAGAGAASVANIVFGWLSDRGVAAGHTRRGWIAGGLIATVLGYVAIHAASTPRAIVAAVAAWQVGVNMLLAPLFAAMADDVPDDRKGLAGALLTVAQPIAATVSALLATLAAAGESARFALLCGLVVIGVAPVLFLRPARHGPATVTLPRSRGPARHIALALIARLMTQVASHVLALYLLIYLGRHGPGVPATTVAATTGQILAVAYALAVPVALVAGRLSDRVRRRAPFLLGAAAAASAGLAIMATATAWPLAIVGIMLQACGSAVFLALHSVAVMQVLPVPERRGVALGIVNLANTVPALVAPLLAWGFAASGDFTTILWMLAAMTLAGGALAALAQRR